MDNKVTFQRLGILLAYPLAYSYIRLIFNSADVSEMGPEIFNGKLTIALTYPVFALLFILANEIIRRGRRGEKSLPGKETLFWYSMTFLAGLTATVGPALELSLFAMHLCGVYSVLMSNGILLGGKTSGFIPVDLIHGFYVKSFAGFPNYVVDWKCFKKPASDGDAPAAQKKSVLGAVIFIFVMVVLLIISVSLMSSIDEDLGNFFSVIFRDLEDYLTELKMYEIIPRLIFAVPVCFYLYGLMSRSARSDGAREKRFASRLTSFMGRGKTASAIVVYIAAGVFVLAYILFFIKRLAYMMGGFSGDVPEGMLVSHYAREGFFELVGIMAVNMCVYLAIILFGKTDQDGKFSVPAKILVTLLMVESIIFAVIAMSKLGLYYSIYGYTPKRILAMWATLALGFAAGLTIATIHRGKPHFRAGVIFTSVSYIAICILSGVLVAAGA